MNSPVSVILNADQFRQLERWLGYRPEWKMLYRGSLDTNNSATWHQKCDNQGATITVVRLTNGRVFGGYANLPWNAAIGNYQNDPKSWLFRLEPGPALLITNKNGPHSLYHNTSYGPTFGGGHDLYIANGWSSSYSRVAATSTSYNLPTGEDQDTILAGAYNGWSIAEVETFAVGQKKRAVALHRPNWGDVTNMRNRIRNYMPSHRDILGIRQVNIALFGGAGAGKSTTINSILTAMLGRVVNRAISGGNSKHVTTRYGDFGVHSFLRLCDTMGWSLTNYKGAALEFMLDGLLEFDFDFSKEPVFGKPGTRTNPEFSDRVHSICIFIPATEVSQPEYIDRLKEFIERCRSRDLQVLLVLSKIDDYESVLEDPANYPQLYELDSVQGLLEDIHEATGLPIMNIIPMVNYHKVYGIDNHLDYFALYLLQRAIDNAEDYFDVKANELRRNATEH